MSAGVAMAPTRPLAYARQQQGRFVNDLKAFLRFASVSAQPRHARDIRKCAEWLATHLRQIGLRGVSVI
jgi:acetylornithine deacetylase/succinyl-diaminopimelate desuccinylase-like protein